MVSNANQAQATANCMNQNPNPTQPYQGSLPSSGPTVTSDNLDLLFNVLPPNVAAAIQRHPEGTRVIEVVLDLGRKVEIRFPDQVWEPFPDTEVTADDIATVVELISEFGEDNRAGIERTLHRISAIRNRKDEIVGLTCRVGRSVHGTVDIIRDIVESGQSILLLGRPGVGKTTKLRETARIIADELGRRVVIVDTSNEIAGDGNVPHPAIGRARRMQVKRPELQHSVMIEAVENHMPQVVVIDEIGTEQEAFAARTIAERGVQLVGTAHGNTLENLMLNPTLSDLVGGIQTVTLGDEEARRRGTQKSVLERKAPPTFDVVIEILDVNKLAIHHDVAKVVDKLLRGQQPRPEVRQRAQDGKVEVVQARVLPPDRPGEVTGGTYGVTFDPIENRYSSDFGRSDDLTDERHAEADAGPPKQKVLKLFPYGVSKSRLDRAIMQARVPAMIVRDFTDADVVVALKATFRRDPAKMHDARSRGASVVVVKSNTYIQIENLVRDIFGIPHSIAPSEEDDALGEAEDAVNSVTDSGEMVELPPRNAYVRRLQHQVIEAAGLLSESVGVEPRRRLRVYRHRDQDA